MNYFYTAFYLFLFPILLISSSCGLFKSRKEAATHIEMNNMGVRALSLSGTGTLRINQGEKEQYLIEAEDSVMPYITTAIKKPTLSIVVDTKRMPPELQRSHKPIIFTVFLKSIDSIDVSGGITVISDSIDTPKLTLKTAGGVDITLSGKAADQNLQLSGSVNYKGENLKSETCTIDGSGAITGTVNCSDTLTGSLSGACKLLYVGNPQVNVQTFGASEVKTQN